MAHLFKERVRTAPQCVHSSHASKWPPTTSAPAKCTAEWTCRLLLFLKTAPLRFVLCYLMLRTYAQLNLTVDIFKSSHLHILQRGISVCVRVCVHAAHIRERQAVCLQPQTSVVTSTDSDRVPCDGYMCAFLFFLLLPQRQSHNLCIVATGIYRGL